MIGVAPPEKCTAMPIVSPVIRVSCASSTPLMRSSSARGPVIVEPQLKLVGELVPVPFSQHHHRRVIHTSRRPVQYRRSDVPKRQRRQKRNSTQREQAPTLLLPSYRRRRVPSALFGQQHHDALLEHRARIAPAVSGHFLDAPEHTELTVAQHQDVRACLVQIRRDLRGQNGDVVALVS